MKSRIWLTVMAAILFVILTGCGGVANCPVCGTTQGGQYAVIDVIAVPEHNPTGEPGGPFNSFDISFISTPPSGGLSGSDNLDFVSDRIGIVVQVIDTSTDLAVNALGGANSVTGAGDNASACVAVGADPVSPPLVSVLGNWTRFGCRTGAFSIPGFGSNGLFGGFTGGQCCAARSNQINPLSGPNGIIVTPDGNTLYVGNGSSSFVVFDLTSMNLTTNPPTPPNVLAAIPTGLSPDFDGEAGNSVPDPPIYPGGGGNTTGIAGCAASANGRAFSDPTCGDLRGDEIAYDSKDQILAIINGDPGLPFVSFFDVSGLNARTSNCQPILTGQPYGPPQGSYLGPINAPTCLLGQIYYDGAFPVDNTVLVDNNNGFNCPDQSNPQVNTGMSGDNGYLAGGATIPCHHGGIVDNATGIYDPNCTSSCIGEISPAGLGELAWDPVSGYFLEPNANSTGVLNVGNIDVINPLSPVGPIVVNSIPILNCMPTGVTQGPGTNFLVGCADHDGQAFPPNEVIISSTGGGNFAVVATIYNTGGVDETWYNPGDNRYYLAGRDMSPPQMGVIDAGTNQWLTNFPVNTNAHSIAVDPKTNHVFMPQQAGAICGTQTSNGCIDVIAQQ